MTWEGSVIRRRNKLWLKVKNAQGQWVQQKTDFRVGEEEDARKLLKTIRDQLEAGRQYRAPDTGKLTVRTFSVPWMERRIKFGVRDTSHDGTRLRLHILPIIGDLELSAVRPRHLVGLVDAMLAKGFAPRTIHNVYAVCRSLFRDAATLGLIDNTPCILGRYELPKKADKHREWRRGAIFTREEMERLVWAEEIPLDRRLRYAFMFFLGVRVSEMTALRVRHYEPEATPLGRIMVFRSGTSDRTKTMVEREAPVHPAFAPLLAEWLLSGFREHFGRAPQREDYLLPAPRNINKMLSRHVSWEGFRDDLERLGLRHRRQHDARRTFISLMRREGAQDYVLKAITHGRESDVLGDYTEIAWEAKCEAVLKLRISSSRGSGLVHALVHAPPSIEKHSKTKVTPRGFEP